MRCFGGKGTYRPLLSLSRSLTFSHLTYHRKHHEDRRAFSGRSYLLVRGCVHRLHRVVEVSERREST